MPPKKHSNQISNKKTNKVKLVDIINLKNSLVLLANSINWEYFENKFGKFYNLEIGRPAIDTRLMISVHYLKYAYNMSDRTILELWVENFYWQYFSGMKFAVHKLPIHYSTMCRWRQRIGESGVEKLLKQTIETGLKLKIISNKQFEDINIDTTVQEKYIRFPTDSRLYFRPIQTLVKLANKLDIRLTESYEILIKSLLYKQTRYMHTKETEIVDECREQFRTYLGKILMNFQNSELVFNKEIRFFLNTIRKIYFQKIDSKSKIYSLHEPDVECISKGKLHKEFEFGNKVSIAATSDGGWVVGAKAFHGNPYDGHTLKESLWQVYRFIGAPIRVFVDMGYRGHDYFGKVKIYIKTWAKGLMSDELWNKAKRRVAIEPTIGHLKNTYRMNRNRLKGKLGDCINIILSAAGMNFRKLLKAVIFLFYLLCDLRIKISILK